MSKNRTKKDYKALAKILNDHPEASALFQDSVYEEWNLFGSDTPETWHFDDNTPFYVVKNSKGKWVVKEDG